MDASCPIPFYTSLLRRILCASVRNAYFVQRSIVVLLTASFLGLGLGHAPAQGFRTLDEAYAELGFEPSAPDSHVVVLASDVHMNLNVNSMPAPVATTNLDPRMVAVINSMNPPPAKILFSGDVSSSMAAIPGGDATGDIPTLRNATNEMVFFRNSLEALTNINQTNILWIPGNHDVGAFESDAQTFRKIFPNMPPYQKFEFAGMHWFLLSPGNYGSPDEPQKEWARAEVAKLQPTNTVVVMTHQPPFANPVAHRGMGLLLRELFGEWQTRWWLLDGHEHARSLEVWQVGNSKVAQIMAGPATTNTFVGFSYDVGFIFLCVTNGGIAGQIYYHYGTDRYVVWAQPDWDWPRKYVPAFENVQGLLWRRLKPGFGKPPEQLQAVAADSIEWWAYPRMLEWEMPLERYNNEATHFVMAIAGLTTTAVIECSADRTNWISLTPPPPKNLIYSFPIPPQLANLPKAFLRLRSQDFGNNWVGGWGLLTTNGLGGFIYPKLEPVDDQFAYPGKGMAVPMRVTSPYSPPDPLRFQLLAGPAGALVHPLTGVFSWTPPAATDPGDFPVTVQVRDTGTPSATSTQSFTIRLLAGGGTVLSQPRFSSEGALKVRAVGDPGSLRVLYSVDSAAWEVLTVTNGPAFSFEIDTGSGALPQQFYTVRHDLGLPSAAGPWPWPVEPPYIVEARTPDAIFHVLASTNLVDWVEVGSTNVSGSTIRLSDPSAERWLPRTYRAELEQ